MIAKTKGMKYESGESKFRQGKEQWNEGEFSLYGGHGSYRTVVPAHFILTVVLDGEENEVWMERNFRKALRIKQLTKKRRDAIAKVMPNEVSLVRCVGQLGTVYYRLTPECLEAWAAAVSLPK